MKNRSLLKYWPIGVIVVTSIILFWINYFPGTYLLGWDVTMPELNVWLNLKRYFFAVWQEYRGLGTVDGQSYTANIMHWVYIAFLSLFLPHNMIRYVFTFGTHLIGGLGMYFLLRYEVIPRFLTNFAITIRKNKRTKQVVPSFSPHILGIFSLIGATFYQLNFITTQTYYLPFETFTIHFAFIPWGILSIQRYLNKPSFKNIWWVAVIHILGVSQAQVPSLFIGYAVVVLFLFLFYLFYQKRNAIKPLLVAILVLFCVNSFWGLPYLYTGMVKAPEIASSKQNRYSTPAMFYRNVTYGNLGSVLKMGGFNLDYINYNSVSQEFDKTMRIWASFYESVFYSATSIFLSLVAICAVLLSFFHGFFKKNKYILPYAVIWLFFFLMLTNDTPILGSVFHIFKKYIPLFYTVFRSPFGKFSILYSMFTSLFLAISVLLIYITFLYKAVTQKLIKIPFYFISLILLILIFLNSKPNFNKHLFFPEIRVRIPDSYHQMIEYLSSNHTHSRLASFPIHSFWGWITNSSYWGYIGSGFMWQAIPQPIHDRAFDGWSRYDETAFLQLHDALYSLNGEKLFKTFQKFSTNGVLLDKTYFYPGGEKQALFYNQFEQLRTEQIPELKKVKSTQDLDLFLFQPESDVIAPFTPRQLVNISPKYQTEYTYHDQAYEDLGSYFQSFENQGLEYPFSFLQQEEIQPEEVFAKNDQSSITFSWKTKTPKQIHFASLKQSEQRVPVALFAKKSDNQTIIQAHIQLPQITVNDERVTEGTRIIQTSYSVDDTATGKILIYFNGHLTHIYLNNLTNEFLHLKTFSLPFIDEVSFLVYDGTPYLNQDMTSDFLSNQPYFCQTSYPTQQKKNNSGISFDASSEDVCLSLLSEPNFPEEEIDQPFLLAVAANFKSSTRTPPDICINDTQAPFCINSPVYDYFVGKETWQRVVSYTPYNPQLEYTTTLIGRSTDLTQENTKQNSFVEYDHISLLMYPFLGKITVPLKQSLAKFDLSIQGLNTKQVSSLDISIPKGNQKAFIVDALEKSKETEAFNCSFFQQGETEKTVTNNGVCFSASKKGSLCDSNIQLPLSNELEYLYLLQGSYFGGVGLNQKLINPETKNFELEIQTPQKNFHQWYPLTFGQTYSKSNNNLYDFKTQATSYGREQNESAIHQAEFLILPLKWLNKIRTNDVSPHTHIFSSNIISWDKWGPFYYKIHAITDSTSGMVALPQAYDPGWIAFDASSNRLLRHVIYNGWANGWITNRGQNTIYILFWPQILSFLGYILLSFCMIFISAKILFNKNRKHSAERQLPHKMKTARSKLLGKTKL